MCIFSNRVRVVQKTTLINWQKSATERRVFYCNHVATDTANAMILPVNGRVTGMANADACKKLGSDFASKMSTEFARWNHEASRGRSGNQERSVKRAAVIQWGSYELSIATRLSEIDWKTFGTPESVVKTLQDLYETPATAAEKVEAVKAEKTAAVVAKAAAPEYSFVVCKMQACKTAKDMHPIAFDVSMPADGSQPMMLPTLHVHHGTVPDSINEWDHVIFYFASGHHIDAPVFGTENRKHGFTLLADHKRYSENCVNTLVFDESHEKNPPPPKSEADTWWTVQATFPSIRLVATVMPDLPTPTACRLLHLHGTHPNRDVVIRHTPAPAAENATAIVTKVEVPA